MLSKSQKQVNNNVTGKTIHIIRLKKYTLEKQYLVKYF